MMPGRVYEPETLVLMGAALDKAAQFLSIKDRASKELVALMIIRHTDRGECDLGQLTACAIREWVFKPKPRTRPSEGAQAAL